MGSETTDFNAMTQAHQHLAFAPRGAGLLYALLWFAEGDHVYGWFIGSKDGGHRASYFMMQDYYSMRDTRLLCSAEDDVYGRWLDVQGAVEEEVAHRPPVPDVLCHELSRLQDQFVRHWLFFDDDPHAAEEAEALRRRELPVRHVNIRASRLDKLRTAPAVWRYDASGADRNVLSYLSKRWPLDFEAQD